jgi:Flp pilus assembly protein TadD
MSSFQQQGHGMLTAIPTPKVPSPERASPEALGALSLQQGDKLSALRYYEEAVRRAPSDPAVQKALADFYLVALGKRAEAYAAYKRVLTLNPDAVETLQILANLAVTDNKLGEAREYYTAILRLEPWNQQARHAIANMPGSPEVRPSTGPTADPFRNMVHHVQRSVSTGEDAEVERGLDRLVELKRVTAEGPSRAAVGQRHAAAGRLEQAAAAFEGHLQLAPGDAQTRNDLGVVYYRLGRKEAALEQYEAAYRLEPENITFAKNLADFLLVERAELERALGIYVRALRARPRDVELLGAIAYVSAAAGKVDDAKFFLSRILDIEPWNSSVKDLLEKVSPDGPQQGLTTFRDDILTEARDHIASGDLTGARAALETILATSPRNAAALNDLAIVCYRLGQKDEALGLFQSAVQCDPDEPSYQKNLADCLAVDAGRYEDALRVYVEILRRDPRNVDTLMGLGNICRLMGRTADARDFYSKAVAVEPGHQAAHDALTSLGE